MSWACYNIYRKYFFEVVDIFIIHSYEDVIQLSREDTERGK